jgi:hypothetical protein
MLKTAEGLYINIHEAALVNYPAMNLIIDKHNYTLTSTSVPDALGNKALFETPAKTPENHHASDKATDILASHTILNLNEPSVIKRSQLDKNQQNMWDMVGDACRQIYFGTMQSECQQF